MSEFDEPPISFEMAIACDLLTGRQVRSIEARARADTDAVEDADPTLSGADLDAYRQERQEHYLDVLFDEQQRDRLRRRYAFVARRPLRVRRRRPVCPARPPQTGRPRARRSRTPATRSCARSGDSGDDEPEGSSRAALRARVAR